MESVIPVGGERKNVCRQIRVSLTERGAEDGLCSRVYRAPQLQPSTASSLRLNYAVADAKTRDALLLYLPSRTRVGRIVYSY